MRACSAPYARPFAIGLFRRRLEVESIVGRARSKIMRLVFEVAFVLSKIVGVALLLLTSPASPRTAV